ncbi:MAG: hypothetical protein DRP55_07740 [Spirochaetes bacterium]|nr:MAG: hypothetical protein DRP55_07740 [Spirochaetota bacterium]
MSNTSNPFALYYIDDKDTATPNQRQRAMRASRKLKKLLDTLIKDIIAIAPSRAYTGIMKPVAETITEMTQRHVGIGDTETDNCIANYLEDGLKKKWDTDAVNFERIAENFYFMIH